MFSRAKGFYVVLMPFILLAGVCRNNVKSPPANDPPTIDNVQTNIRPDEIISGEIVEITVYASDPNHDSIYYNFNSDTIFLTAIGNKAEFIAPSNEGTHIVYIEATDSIQGNPPDQDSIIFDVCFSTSMGIYSESEHCYFGLDQNSYIGTYFGGGANIIEFEDDHNEKVEGDYSKKMTINVASTSEWAGWFVVYGLEGTPEDTCRDMNLFDGGELRFSINSEISNLLISIRSSDVPADGSEAKIFLNTIPEFSVGEWCDISIPLVQFTSGSPPANLDCIKVLFNIASNQATGGTDGTQSFWADNVRWVRSGY